MSGCWRTEPEPERRDFDFDGGVDVGVVLPLELLDEAAGLVGEATAGLRGGGESSKERSSAERSMPSRAIFAAGDAMVAPGLIGEPCACEPVCGAGAGGREEREATSACIKRSESKSRSCA